MKLKIICILVLLPTVLWNCKNRLNEEKNAQKSIIDVEKLYLPPLESYSNFSEELIEIDTLFEQFRRQWEMVGLSVAMVKDGRLVYAKGFGYADKEKQEEVHPFHLFRIASVSKLFTAVGIMKLVEEGKLNLQDKVFGKNGILSEYTQIADTLTYQINIEHLLTHTAGWRNQLRTDPMFVPTMVAAIMKVQSPPTLETIIQFMLSQKGMFQPGALYDYSNFGYCLLGAIIEKKTGMTYERYMQSQILSPIGINRMRIAKNSLKDRFPNEVKYYTHSKELKNLSIYGTGDSASRAYEGTNIEQLGAAGAWIATPTDLLKLIIAIDGFESKPDFLKKQTIERMTTAIPNDTTSTRLLGWKSIDAEKWWRTGSLASTGISLTRRNDGISWAVVTNTGSWRGPFFSYEIEGLMRRAVQKIKKFPDWDLFGLDLR